jgi:1-acyl-sn-glycerol-3-phosphate acyltransferase
MRSGILYLFIRPFAKIAIGLYFRKIHLIDADRIPTKGPLILACNHPNSFTEACILATFQPRVLHFLVRGDVFKNSVIAFMLRQTNQIPIFRFKDGFSNLKQNESTFAACYEKLNENAAILIFSEASSVFEKRLRPIQKGTARLAFGAYNKNQTKEELNILPVGVNYTKGDKFRSEVMVSFGLPIRLSAYSSQYENNPKTGIDSLTADLAEAQSALVIQINDKSRDKLYDDCMEMVESIQEKSYYNPITRAHSRFNWEKKLAKKINSLNEDQVSELRIKLSALKNCIPGDSKSLNRLNYMDLNPVKQQIRTLFWLLPSLPGLVYFFVPFILSKLLAIPFLRYREFYTGVRIGSILILGLLQGLTLLIIAVILQWYWLIIAIVFMPLLAWFTVQYLESYRSMRHAYTWALARKKSMKAQTLRNELLQFLDFN